MNLVKLITDQLSDQALGQLSGLLGTDSETAGTAATAAVPALLSGLAGMASSSDGAKKATSVLNGLDVSSIGNLANMLGGNSGSLLQKGSGLLGSLFGDSMISSAASAISRFSGLNLGAAKTLLSYLAPLVLGKVATQWKMQGGTPAALTSMLADQKRNIAEAIPAGLSLDDIPGADVVRGAAQTTRRTAETAGRAAPSLASWALPLALLLACGFLLWNFILRPRNEAAPAVANNATTPADRVTALKPVIPDASAMPDVTKLSTEMTGLFKSVTDTLGGIKDAASAEAAAPKLEELNAKLDTMKAMVARMPETGRATLQRLLDQQLNPLKEQAKQTLSVPGLTERIKGLIAQIVTKLEEWHVIGQKG